jgi:hypothetical protein
MPMVRIGHVRMFMGQRCVPVHVRVGLPSHLVMLVGVMLVVKVSAIVFHVLVRVNVLVLGPQKHGDASRHDRHREQLACTEVLLEQTGGDERTDEWSRREVGSFPRRAQQAERAHREHDAQAVAGEPKNHPESQLP